MYIKLYYISLILYYNVLLKYINILKIIEKHFIFIE